MERVNINGDYDFCLNYIINNPNKNTTYETVFKKMFPNIYKEFQLVNWCEELPFRQLLYHFLHNDILLNIGRCEICGKRTRFISFNKGYNQYCSSICSNKGKGVKISKTKLNRSKEEKEEIEKKRNDTLKRNFGDNYYEKVLPEKISNTRKQFSKEHLKLILDKQHKTCLEKYGVESYSQTQDFKDIFKNNDEFVSRCKKTKMELYGNENFNNREKATETMIEKYGVKSYSQTQEFKEKYISTNYKLYGVKNYSQTQEFIIKNYNTKKKNNTFTTSKLEDCISDKLNEHGIKFIRQYNCKKYPFNCDFYFPEYDLFVEIQGSWTHGGKPYCGTEEDLHIVNEWRKKNTEYYDNAIYCWTKMDVMKRNLAKENNLNYIEIFSNDVDKCIYVILEKIYS